MSRVGIGRTGLIMADKYPNFAALDKKERSGFAFDILVRRAAPAFAIVAPHGGGIELLHGMLTNHLDLARKLLKGRAKPYLYYRVAS
jgi:phage replication-related protein YjqB (UPF0714/DUF867 family)